MFRESAVKYISDVEQHRVFLSEKQTSMGNGANNVYPNMKQRDRQTLERIHMSASFNSIRRAFYSGKSEWCAFTAYFRQPARKVRAESNDGELESD